MPTTWDVLAAFFSKDDPELDDIVSVIQYWIDSEYTDISTTEAFLARVKAERSVQVDFACVNGLSAVCRYVYEPDHPAGLDYDDWIEFGICNSSPNRCTVYVYRALLSTDLTQIYQVTTSRATLVEMRDRIRLIQQI